VKLKDLLSFNSASSLTYCLINTPSVSGGSRCVLGTFLSLKASVWFLLWHSAHAHRAARSGSSTRPARYRGEKTSSASLTSFMFPCFTGKIYIYKVSFLFEKHVFLQTFRHLFIWLHKINRCHGDSRCYFVLVLKRKNYILQIEPFKNKKFCIFMQPNEEQNTFRPGNKILCLHYYFYCRYI